MFSKFITLIQSHTKEAIISLYISAMLSSVTFLVILPSFSAGIPAPAWAHGLVVGLTGNLMFFLLFGISIWVTNRTGI